MKACRCWIAIASLLLTVAMAGEVRAQSGYPNKTVQIVVDSAAGSANDATARILADKLSKIWGQSVLTLNQPGAGTIDPALHRAHPHVADIGGFFVG